MLLLKLLIIFNMFTVGTAIANDPPLAVIETIIYEASGESLQGQILVACTIRNRAEQRGLTYEQTVKQPKQFSCWNTQKHRKYTQAEYIKAKTAWYRAIESNVNVNHYHTINVHPSWANSLIFVIKDGNHIFYTDR